MAFDLYFAGSQAAEAEEKLEQLNCLRLASYLNDKVLLKRRISKGLQTFVDSGAFTAHTKGKDIDLDTYISWLNENDDFVRIAAELDHIPGRWGQPKTKQQLEEAPVISWNNYVYMRDRVKSWEKVLPIFHQGEDFIHLTRMLDEKVPYIGISTSKELSQKSRNIWMVHVFELIKKSSHPNVKTHAFGMTSLPALEMFPFTSADSTSWIMTGANGSIMTKYGTVVVSEKHKKDPKYITNLPPKIRKSFNDYVESMGYTMKDLSENYKYRMLFNIDFLYQWAQNYEYKPQLLKQNLLF